MRLRSVKLYLRHAIRQRYISPIRNSYGLAGYCSFPDTDQTFLRLLVAGLAPGLVTVLARACSHCRGPAAAGPGSGRRPSLPVAVAVEGGGLRGLDATAAGRDAPGGTEHF